MSVTPSEVKNQNVVAAIIIESMLLENEYVLEKREETILEWLKSTWTAWRYLKNTKLLERLKLFRLSINAHKSIEKLWARCAFVFGTSRFIKVIVLQVIFLTFTKTKRFDLGNQPRVDEEKIKRYFREKRQRIERCYCVKTINAIN